MLTRLVGYTVRVTGIRGRLKNMSWRSWIVGVGISGVLAGVMRGVDHQSVSDGISVGVFTGVGAGIFSLMTGRNRRRELLPELSDSDRATVVRTVREGSMVADAQLALAVIAYTEIVREDSSEKWTRSRAERLLSGLLVLLCGCFAVDGHWHGNDAAAVMWVLFAGVIVAGAVVGPRRREQKLRRLERVERSARAFVEAPW